MDLETKYDAVLLGLAQQLEGGVPQLFDVLFGYVFFKFCNQVSFQLDAIMKELGSSNILLKYCFQTINFL